MTRVSEALSTKSRFSVNRQYKYSHPTFLSPTNCIVFSLSPSPSLAIYCSPLRRRSTSISVFSTSAPDDPPPPSPNQNAQRKVPDLETLTRRFWKVAAPYWYSDDKVQARLQLAAVFALTFATTGISVGFSFLGRDFYNALSNKDQEQFTKQLLYYLAGFAGGIPFFVLRDYAKEVLSLRWRSWMTNYYMERYLRNQTFYKIQSQSIIDNPDQRIVDDLSSFTAAALSFSLTIFNATIDLISFSNILFGIYPPLFVILLVYSIGGTFISIYLGKGLVSLNFLQEKKEADFRYGLVRVRENAESIAFYGGEENEKQLLLQRFRSAFDNLSQLLISSRNLDFFTSGYRYLIQILPAAIVAPMFFSGKIEFGVINQSVSAFNHILGDFSLIVFQFQSISAFSAVIDRLGEFDDVLDSSNASVPLEEIQLTYCNLETSNLLHPDKLLDIANLTLKTPTGDTTLVRDLSMQIYESDRLLVMGPSGSGKTSLLRSIAGLWNTGRGSIKFYTKEEKIATQKNSRAAGIFFLPQRPYMVLGTLRQQLLYPTWTQHSDSTKSADSLPSFLKGSDDNDEDKMQQRSGKPPTTAELIKVLQDVCLENIISRFDSLDSTQEWSSVLSLGEQQRLAFARLLLSKPQLVLLDESTSALDEQNEANLYKLIEAAGITYVSVGHRRSLYEYHNRILRISSSDNTAEKQQNWSLDSIDQDFVTV